MSAVELIGVLSSVFTVVAGLGATAKVIWQAARTLERISDRLEDHDRRISRLEKVT